MATRCSMLKSPRGSSKLDGKRDIPSMKRQVLRRILALFTYSLIISGCLIDKLGGAFTHQPEELETNASPLARKLIEEAFEGIDASRLGDHHVHILALGTSFRRAFVNPRVLTGMNLERAKFWIYASAAGIRGRKNADAAYLSRLARL